MHAGHSGKIMKEEGYIPVHHISPKLDNSISHCLPSMHDARLVRMRYDKQNVVLTS